MSSLIKGAAGPLVGAAAVRELTEPLSAESRALLDAGLKSGRKEPAVSLGSFTADVENDGDRGPRPIDQVTGAPRAQYVQHLMSAVAGLSVDEIAALAWIAWQLPGRKLRRKCEEATATGWCGSDLAANAPAGRSTPEDRTRAALLAAWRQVVALVHGARSSASEDLRQRTREHVLADEAARRAGGAK
jgi:hypothetical protein